MDGAARVLKITWTEYEMFFDNLLQSDVFNELLSFTLMNDVRILIEWLIVKTTLVKLPTQFFQKV